MKNFNSKIELEALENLGLSQKEALIYLSALDLGGGTVSDIAENGGIERTGIYYHIDKLLREDLLRTASRGKRTFYLPADPDNLKVILKHKEKDLSLVLPKLAQQFATSTGKSVVEYFQGEKEVNKFYDRVYDLLKELNAPDNEICILGASYNKITSSGKAFTEFSPPTDKIDIKIRTILPESSRLPGPDGNAGDPYIVTRYNLPRANIKFINDKYAYPGSVVITKDRVILYDPRTLFFSITESAVIAATWRMFFEFIWDRL